jgi:hypothetical protein
MAARRLGFVSVIVALGVSLGACGDDAGGSGTGSGGGGTGGGAASTTGAATGTTTGAVGPTTGAGGGGEVDCKLPVDGVDTSPQPTEVGEVRGTVLDLDGEPVTDAEVQVCGKNLCLYGDTGPDGGFVVTNTSGEELDTPIVKSGDGLAFARFGYAMPVDGEEVDATTAALTDSGTAMAAGAVAEADGVTLTIAADGVVGINLLDFGDPGEDTFRAAVIPQDQVDLIAPGEAFDMVIGLGPHETLFCPAAQLTVPNDAGLAAGAEVDVLLYGLQIGDSFVAYGTWSRVAGGVVSEDGATITTDAEALPVLGPIGIRLAE